MYVLFFTPIIQRGAKAGQTHENDNLKKIKVFTVPVAHLVGRT
jgi:hypothetical protein